MNISLMPQMNPDSLATIQPELTSGESILWAGQPSSSVIFHKEDALLIPFSLLWGGFAIFWEAGVAGLWGTASHANGSWTFGIIWGIPFVLVGQYFIWGRFLVMAWKKKGTHYAVTTRRVIVVQNSWSRQMVSAYLDTLPNIIKEESKNGIGSLNFAPPQVSLSRGRRWGAWDGMSIGTVPTFVDVEDVDSLYRLISDLREKAGATQ